MKPGAGTRWSFAATQDRLQSLRGRLGFPDAPVLSILDLRISLDSGEITAWPDDDPVPGIGPGLFCILDRYAQSREVPETFSLLPFDNLPGASAYAAAFRSRTTVPLGKRWETSSGQISMRMAGFGAMPVAFAHRAWKLLPLPLVPVYLLFWDGDDEIPASANLLFDASVTAYLETEQAGMLGELIAERLLSQP